MKHAEWEIRRELLDYEFLPGDDGATYLHLYYEVLMGVGYQFNCWKEHHTGPKTGQGERKDEQKHPAVSGKDRAGGVLDGISSSLRKRAESRSPLKGEMPPQRQRGSNQSQQMLDPGTPR